MNNNGGVNPGKGWFNYFGRVSMVRKEKLHVTRLEKNKEYNSVVGTVEVKMHWMRGAVVVKANYVKSLSVLLNAGALIVDG